MLANKKMLVLGMVTSFWAAGQWDHVDPPKHGKRFANTLGYPPEAEGKTPWPKTPHTWVVEYGNINPVLTWKSYLYWLAFRVGGCYAQCWRRKTSLRLPKLWTLWATTMTGVTRCDTLSNGGISGAGVSNHALIGFKPKRTWWQRTYG